MVIESRWFRVPRVGDGSDLNAFRPKYSGRLDAFSCFYLPADGVALVRAYADPGILDEISEQLDANEVPAASALMAFNEREDDAGVQMNDVAELESAFKCELGGKNVN